MKIFENYNIDSMPVLYNNDTFNINMRFGMYQILESVSKNILLTHFFLIRLIKTG